MKKISYKIYPNQKTTCLTFSYDDGETNDIRLSALLKKYGFKGTFNLNSSNLGKPKYITEEDVKNLVKDGFEIAVHSVTHPFLETLAIEHITAEVLEDKRALERITGTIITGMAYPFGTYDERVKEVLKACGIKYARTVKYNGFNFPADFLEWHATCHHNDLDKVSIDNLRYSNILYVWGHSYEFRTEEDWQKFENNLKRVHDNGSFWCATNGEIYEYITAQRNLIFNADLTAVYNPSAITVYIIVDGTVVELPSGKTVSI